MIITQQIKDQLYQSYLSIVKDVSDDQEVTSLYGIDIADISNPTLLSAGHKVDIYEVIHSSSTSVYMSFYDQLAFVSYGWAIGNDDTDGFDEISPSEHPNKKRVRMINFFSCDQYYIVTSLEIDFGLPSVIHDWEYKNQTVGSLKDSFKELYSSKTDI